MEDKKLKKELAKIPDVDKNGDPIYKIAGNTSGGSKSDDKSRNAEKRDSKWVLLVLIKSIKIKSLTRSGAAEPSSLPVGV